MKNIDVSKDTIMKQDDPVKYINETIRNADEAGIIKANDISDGYHTFGELYEHRIVLFMAMCHFMLNTNLLHKDYVGDMYKIKKSKLHFDGSEMEGWFIIQIETPEGQISYHLPDRYWDRCDFIRTVDKANEWDGHTSQDVLERLLKLIG